MTLRERETPTPMSYEIAPDATRADRIGPAGPEGSAGPMPDPEESDRVRATIEALQSLLYVYPQADAFTHSLVDLLLLLYFRRVRVTLWIGESETPAFDSAPEQDQLFLGYPPPNRRETPETHMHVWRHSSERSPDIVIRITQVFGRPLSVRTNLLQATLTTLRERSSAAYDDAFELIRLFLPNPDEGLLVGRPPAAALVSARAPVVSATLGDGDEDVILGPFRDRVEAALRAFSAPHSAMRLPSPDSETEVENTASSANFIARPGVERLIDVTAGGLEQTAVTPLNLFLVVRFQPHVGYRRTVTVPHNTTGSGPPGTSVSFDYTAKVLLSEAQRAWVNRALPREVRGDESAADILSYACGPCGRFVADTPFMSGLVDCGDDVRDARESAEARDVPGHGDEKDSARHAIENKTYAMLRGPGREALPIVYIPVHIGGAPWLALYSFARGKDRDQHCYFLYRSVLPNLGQHLRQAAREAFLQCVSDAITSAQERLPKAVAERGLWSETAVDDVNAAWFRAALVYPFERPELRIVGDHVPDDERLLDLGEGRYLALTMREPLWHHPRSIEYDKLPTREVLDRVRSALEPLQRNRISFHEKVAQDNAELLQFIEAFGHELKNGLEEVGWYEMLRRFHAPSESHPSSGEVVQCLSRMWLVQGFGAGMRRAGRLHASPAETDALRRDWLAADETFRYSDDDCEHFRESVRYLFLSLRRAHPESPVVVWEGAPGTLRETSHAEGLTVEEFSPDELNFPPLRFHRTDHQSAMVLACVLAEPLRNAINAAANHPREDWRIIYWSIRPTDDRSAVVVEISNVATRLVDVDEDVPFPSSGVALVEAFAKRLGIGSARQIPQAEWGAVRGSSIHGYRVVQITLHPQFLGMRPSLGVTR